MDYILSRLALNEDKVLKVKPASSYDRMLISTLNHSDCMMKVDKNNCHKGEAVNIYKFRG
jgi:molybdopterin biosynthesis enzyme